MSKPKADSCYLCGTPGPLRQSHIIPKFVFEWAKNRGGGLRDLGTPNVLVQDGLKPRLFCNSCEGRLGEWERQVAGQIFRPVHDGSASPLLYGPWFLKFAVSVSFRVLALHATEFSNLLSEPDPRMRNLEDVKQLGSPSGAWARFLLDKHSILGPYEHHCLLFRPSPATSSVEQRVSAYVEGEINFRPPIRAPDGGIYVVSKMCRLCIIGTVVRGQRGTWQNTRIAAAGGRISWPSTVPAWVVNYLGSIMRVSERSVLSMSPRQLERLLEKGRRLGWDSLNPSDSTARDDSGLTLHAPDGARGFTKRRG